MTSHLWKRTHLGAVWKCFLMSKHVSHNLISSVHIFSKCCNMFGCSVSEAIMGKCTVYLAKICIYEVYLTCGLCKVNTTFCLCSGWVSTCFWFYSSKRETTLTVHTLQFSLKEPVLSYYFRSSPSLLVGFYPWLKSLNSLVLYNSPSLILKRPLFLLPHNTADNIMKYHIGSISGTPIMSAALFSFPVLWCQNLYSSLSMKKMILSQVDT